MTDVETLRIFKDKLTTDMWVELVTNIEHGRSTWIHKMMMRCNKDCLDFILRSLSADVALQLLTAEDATHSTTLDRLCDGLQEDVLSRPTYNSSFDDFLHGPSRYNSSTKEFLQTKELSKSIIIMVMELIKGVGDNGRFFLAESLFDKTVAELRKTDYRATSDFFAESADQFNYCLHILRTVVECVSPHQQLKLLGETNGLDKRLRQHAKSCRVECEEKIGRLQKYRTAAKISIATATNPTPNINEQGKISLQVSFDWYGKSSCVSRSSLNH